MRQSSGTMPTEGSNRARRLSTHCFHWWADHTGAQLLVFLSLSVLAGIGYTHPEWVRNLFLDDGVYDESYFIPSIVRVSNSSSGGADRRVTQRSQPENQSPFQVGGGECVLVAIVDPPSDDGFFTRENLSAIYNVAEGLQELPQVGRLIWLDNVPGFNLFGLSGTLLPSPNASQRQMRTAKERVLENPIALGQLISVDACTLLMHIDLNWFFVTSDDAATTEIRERAEQLAGEVSGANIRFLLTGPVPLHRMVAKNHVDNTVRYQLIGYSIMLISALVLFRGLAAVVIVAVAPAVGVAWTMGMLHFFDLQDNPFNDIIVPVLISLVGLTDSVHLMVEIRQQRAAGFETREAARRGIARVGLACLLTSLTTGIGFVSLSQAHHQIVREFGWCCVVGVAMTFISVLTVIPLGCRSPLGRRLHVGLGKSLIDGQLKRIGVLVQWVLRHHRPVAWGAILATAALALVSFQLTPDERRYSGLSESGEAARGLRHLDRVLGGLEFGNVELRWSPNVNQGEVLRVLNEVDEVLNSEPLIGHPLGLHQMLDALPGEGDPEERMTLLELLPPSLKRAFYAPEHHYARIQFRSQDIGIAAYHDTFTRIEASLDQIESRHPSIALDLQGRSPWRWRNIYQIVTDLAASLGTASVVIWIVLTIFYRSIRIGLVSIVPNVFPLVATGAVLYFTGQHLEMVTVCVFTICIGIAVDDTIHFLTRYEEEMLHSERKTSVRPVLSGGDHEAVIRRAFTGVGSALLMTTIVLVAGLGSAILGDSRDARIFGIMGCLTLSTALFADIVLLPAMLKRFAFPEKATHDDRS